MKIRCCFIYYKDCPAYYRFKEQLKTYKGEHEFELVRVKGTIVHDARNLCLTGKSIVNKAKPELKDFDGTVWIDSDVVVNLENVLYIINSGHDIIGLPYEMRENDSIYNAGFITKDGYIYLPKDTKGLIEVGGQGMGCRYISRKVFETIPPFWFWPDVVEYQDGTIEPIVEDWSFDIKASKAGFRIFCDFDRPVIHNTKEPELKLDKLTRETSIMVNNIMDQLNKLHRVNLALIEYIEKNKKAGG